MIDRKQAACFSGHRNLPQNCDELRAKLKKEIIGLIECGVVFFGAGGALGFDMLAEEMVLELKEDYPQHQAYSCSALPTRAADFKMEQRSASEVLRNS